ncbi:vasculin-like isoform X2 [Pomacea canaliculata]|uniref:vasculin-like isoform X2 n=1 Tax=Pomacea canaliculata TaxID=400727 RepID=UPI000D72EC6D|nr:vasculin-like isoform X2 [Pomacea canaliculata]
MAASNAPKHDFAPAWLKIPSSNPTKPAGSKSSTHQQERGRQRRDDSFLNRYGNDYPRQLNRQNSFELYDASKRYSPTHPKFRHHSVEDDYYYYNYGYYGNYTYDYPMQYSSQPSLLRAPTGRESSKYPQTPSGRYNQMNGSYSNYYYYDFYPHGDAYPGYGTGTHTNSTSKRAQYGWEGRSESKESKDSDPSVDNDDKEKPFNDDFPSLNGMDGDPEPKTSRNTATGGVWDNPPRSKFEEATEMKHSASGIYKALVPNKGQQQTSTPPMEILSSRLVRQPKPLGDKKSEFLKALRKEADSEHVQNGHNEGNHPENNNNMKQRKCSEGGGEVLTNGLSDLQLEHEHEHMANGNTGILSSSLEAEQRLLREMGWDEQDDEVYEITEDDKREFKQLTDKLQQQRNGLTRTLPKAWSPQHIPAFKQQPQAQDLNETLSSSDTDSDEDV